MHSKSRRKFLKQISYGAASLPALTLLSQCSRSKKRPNILFIMSDDHDARAISCYGAKINNTPNIDRIANQGMKFTNCFVTNSICGPSRAVILTGKYSHVNGFMVNEYTKFDPNQQTVAKLLKQAGYQTAVIGKWHLGSAPQGFDYWKILPGQGDYYNPDFIEMGKKKQEQGYVTDLITDSALQWLKQRDTDKPFMLMYQHKAPHRKWLPPIKYLHKYDDVTIPEPETLWDDYRTRSRAAHEQKMTIARYMTAEDLKLVDIDALRKKKKTDLTYGEGMFVRMNKEQQKAWEAAYNPKNEAFRKAHLKGKDLVRWKYQRYIKDYLRCVDSIDENVGRVLDYLDKSGLAENTIVVYTADQGFYLGEHGWFDKRFIYETSLHMPFIIRYPKEIKAGTTSDAFVSNLDFAETFLDFAGVPIPKDMQGQSFRPILRGHVPADWRRSFYYHYYEYPGWHMVKQHYGVRTDRYKLIHFYYDIDAWEMYDLQKDPNELNNIYGNPNYAEVQKKLEIELDRLRKKYGDTEESTQKFLKKYVRWIKENNISFN